VRLEIRLLGELELRRDGRSLPPLDSARAESLLAYLLVHRGAPQPRQRLAFLLWPDSTEPQARTNLRHVLHKLRRALPDADRFLDVGQRTLQWRPDAPIRLDVAEFEAALERDAPAEAVALYGGDLLEGSYDDWVLEPREDLRRRLLEALDRLATELAARGEHAEAIRHAERLQREDPLSEPAYRLLMRLHADRGDRARALRAYHACAAALDAELGIVPSAPTRGLYEALLEAAPVGAEPAEETRAAGVPISTVAPAGDERLRAPALVGRIRERARLVERWRASAAGHAQLVVVTGEPGVGKTRLVDDLRTWCAQRGAVVADARSYHAEGALAYGPVAAWLRSPPFAARRERLEPGRLGELARVLPEIAGAPPAPALPASEQRRRLFDALAHAVVAPGGPILLVADDLHWADRETLQFLHFLLRSEPDAALLVVATARREALDADHPVTALMSALRALDRCTEIELEPLSRDETAVLAERLAGRPLDALAVDRLFAETEGNALFVVEAVRAGWEEGGSLTPRVQAAIELRLAQLSPSARELAGVAATVGREFATDVLAEASEVGEAELVRALDELWRRRIVRDRGPEAYDFTHDKLREVAYAALSPARRRQAHRLVAGALERIHAGDPGPVSGQIAMHHDRAGARSAAVAWYGRAAEAAQLLHADAEAIRLLERALQLLRTLPRDDARERDLVAAALPPVANVEGFSSPRLAALHDRGLALARGLGVEPDPPLVRSLALAGLSRGDFASARRFGERLRAGGDAAFVVEGDYVLGVAAFWQGELRAARTHLAAAAARHRPEHRAAHLVRYGLDPEVVCLSRLGNTLWFLGDTDGALRSRDRALALADAVGHPASRATALVFAAMLALELRDAERLREDTAALAACCAEHDVKAPAVAAESLAGYVDVLDGLAPAGLGRIRRSLDDSRAGHAPGQYASIVRVLLDAYAAARDPHGGLAAADLPVVPRLWEAETGRMRAEFLAALGAPREAVDLELRRALTTARRQGARALEERIAATRGTLAERLAAQAAQP